MVKMLVYQAEVHVAWRGLNCTVVSCASSSTGFGVLQEGPSGDYRVQLWCWLAAGV